jgi:hypothetical protein
LLTNCHSRSIKFKVGEEGGKYSNAMPSASATDWTRAQRWERALSKTSVIGTGKPKATSFRSNWQTLSALI